MVRTFMEEGTMDGRLNETNICLIPKKAHPHKLSDFRPISLCNYVFKVASKLMSSRLKRVLPTLISENQTAFVKGRLIYDNILIAHELLHALRTRDVVSSEFLAIKTDMMKAFDRLEWPFIEKTLRLLGFNEAWISRIMICITTVSYRVLINGRPYEKITSYIKRIAARGTSITLCVHFMCRSFGKQFQSSRKREQNYRNSSCSSSSKCLTYFVCR